MKKVKKFFVLFIVALALVGITPSLPLQTVKQISTVEAAAKVKMNKSKATLLKGKTLQLKISGTKKKVTWKSSNAKIATVNSKGKVTAKKAGTATITAKVNGKTYKCKITVKEVIKISKTKLTLKVGDSYTLKISGTSQKVIWTSSKKTVATVNSKGKVTAKKAGTTTITAKIGGKKYTCKVTVNKKPVLYAPRTNITVAGKESVAINYTKDGTITYNIEDENIVSCEWSDKWADGMTLLYIYGEQVGQTRVTITNSETKDKLVLNVKVTKVREDVINRVLNMAAFGIDKAYKVAKYPSTLHLNQIQYTQKQTTNYGDLIDRMVLRCYAQNSLGGYGYFYVVVIACTSNEHYPGAMKYGGYYYHMSSFSNDPGMSGTILDNKSAMEAYRKIIADPKEILYD